MNTMNFEGFTNEELVILAQAGNSIVVDVLEKIFGEMMK